MPKFKLAAMPMEYNRWHDGTVGKSYILNIWGDDTPARIVEAANVKELQPLFETYVSDMTATGKPLHCFAAMVSHDRSPPGFKKATERGGSLTRDINGQRAMEIMEAKEAEKAAAKVAA